jgi:hypothetical protein
MRCFAQAADGGICEATGPGEQEAGQEGALQDSQPCSCTQDHLQGIRIQYKPTGPVYFVFCRLNPSYPQPLRQCLIPTGHLSTIK